MLRNGEDACDEAYSVNFMDYSELLDLGSASNHCLSLGTCALIKNNTLSISILSGSAQFSISILVQYKSCIYQNNAFIQCLV